MLQQIYFQSQMECPNSYQYFYTTSEVFQVIGSGWSINSFCMDVAMIKMTTSILTHQFFTNGNMLTIMLVQILFPWSSSLLIMHYTFCFLFQNGKSQPLLWRNIHANFWHDGDVDTRNTPRPNSDRRSNRVYCLIPGDIASRHGAKTIGKTITGSISSCVIAIGYARGKPCLDV